MVSPLFSSLIKGLSRPLLKFLLKRNGGDLEAAQEVLQETYLAAYTSFHTFHHKSSFFTWICKIAIHKLADYYRHQVHYRSRIIVPTLNELNSLIDPALSPEEKYSLTELRSHLNQCLDLLPEGYRQLLHLKYYQELSSHQLSLKLNLTPRKLEGRLYRARKALATVIQKEHPELKS